MEIDTAIARKARWTRRCKQLERQILSLCERVRRRDGRIVPSDATALNSRIHTLGEYGEQLIEWLGDAGAGQIVIDRVADKLVDLQDMSHALELAARKMLGFELRSFAPFWTLRRSVTRTESKAKAALDRVAREE